MADRSIIRIGTRPSPLAMTQTKMVCDAIDVATEGVHTEIVTITSEGDRDMRPLRDFAERGVFAGALEQALRRGDIDLAVHSYKDLPLDAPSDLVICAVLEREDPRDAICGMTATSLHTLPRGARIATGSARRASILRTLRADLMPHDIRGNVASRLRTSAERGDDACMLACAGLRRLGLSDSIVEALDVADCVPDAAQGIVAIQARADAIPGSIDWNAVSCADAAWAATVERVVAREVGGGCDRPVGVHVAAPDASATVWTCYVFRATAAGEPGTTTTASVNRADEPVVAARNVLDLLPSLEAV